MMLRFLFLFMCYISFAGAAKAAATIEELSRRVEELEKQQADFLLQMKEPKPQMSTFLDDNLTFGGFFEPCYTIITGPDTDAQAATLNILAFNVAAEYQSHFRFAAQTLSALGVGLQNQHNDPRVVSPGFPTERKYVTPSFVTSLVQGYLEYRQSRALNVQMGLGYVPFGYGFQQRELILFQRRGGPQMVRNGGQIISPLWEGLHVHGSFPSGKNRWGYNAYTFSSPAKVNTLGAGGRAWWSSRDEKVVAGLSVQTAKGETESHETVGADIKVEQFPWLIRSEFFRSTGKGMDPWSVYVEPAIYTSDEKFLFYIFGDFLSDPWNKTNNVLVDKYQRWEYGGGVNWLPTTYTRFRFGITYNDYIGSRSHIDGVNRDFWSFDLSAGVAF